MPVKRVAAHIAAASLILMAGCNPQQAPGDESAIAPRANSVQATSPQAPDSGAGESSVVMGSEPPILPPCLQAEVTNHKIPKYGPLVDGLSVLAPTGDLSVHPGDVIEISVEAVNGFVPRSVFVALPFGVTVMENPPYTTTVTIPPKFLGEFRLSIGAFDENWAVAVPTPVIVDVTLPPTVTLASLRVMPTMLALFDFAPTRSTSIYGMFSDGVEREIDSPAFGTTYDIADPDIATVDQNGLITATAPGKTSLTVTNGTVSVTVPVYVKFESTPPPSRSGTVG